MIGIDPHWIAVAQVYATLSQAAAQRATTHAAADVNLEGGGSNPELRASRQWEEMAKTAVRAAGVEG